MKIQTAVSTLAILAMSAGIASAHFLFIVPDAGDKTAKAFISETLTPDSAVNVAIIGGAKLLIREGGTDTPLSLVKGDTAYTVTLPGSGARVIHGNADLGISSNGSPTPYLLLYYPKTILGDPYRADATVGGKPVEIITKGKAGATVLQLLANGKPIAGEINVIFPGGSQKKLKTSDSGETEALTEKGRYGAWARFFEPGTGERDGKSYSQLRHYGMLVFDTNSAVGTGISATRLDTMPEMTSSFGAAVAGDNLYVYGGHIIPTHNYSTDAVSGKFSGLKLSPGSKWQTLPAGPHVQGMNLAVYKGEIYRIGGMSPRNAPGTPADTWSIADSARFDPATGKWEPLPDLPEARSSHDVVVIGDKLIVSGGWALRGRDKDDVWSKTILTMDLSAKNPVWKPSVQPFMRRALTAAAANGKMYVIGGIDENGVVVNTVSVYDPASEKWTEGPALPVTGEGAFAPAAIEHHKTLYVSVANGTLYRLSSDGRAWEAVASGTPRLAHRIVSHGDEILILGGASGGKNFDLIETVSVKQEF